MQSVTLLSKTRELLALCTQTLPQVAQGSGLTYEWLKKFRTDAIPDPSVNKVQQLHDYLVGLAIESAVDQ